MFLVNVIPLANIPRPQPQILTYFTDQKLTQRSLVLISLKKAKIPALVSSVNALSEKKMEVRKAQFTLKPIERILSKEPFLKKEQFNLACWLSQYYFCSLGIACKIMIPAYILNKLKKGGSLNFSFRRLSSQSQKLLLFPTLWALEDFTKKYKQPMIVHSQLTPACFFKVWKKVYQGQGGTILGTRGAIFLPFENLKTIAIYQEQSPHYKSWDASPKYDARKAALQLAKISQAKITFYSPTPSVNSFYQAQNKKLCLIIKSPKNKTQPKIKIIDLNQEKTPEISLIFSGALKKAIAQYSKAILYLNRRGAASSLSCQDCGLVISCPRCKLPFSYHRLSSGPKLACHHCGISQFVPSFCSQCQGHRLKTWGLGTQGIQKEASRLFPKKEIFRLDKDSAPTIKKQRQILEKFQRSPSALLATTKMIFSLSWLRAPLVAAINFDIDLSLPDYQAEENAFQALRFLASLATQKFIIQTSNPQNSLFEYAFKKDWRSFYQRQIELRKIFDLPPFSTFVKLTFSHKNAKKAELEAKNLKISLKTRLRALGLVKGYQILGPLPAFLPTIKGRYFWQLIIKLKPSFQKFNPQVLKIIPPGWDIDVEPLNLL